ncbi:MAG: GNAT family N-acetyltransferase [Acidimicrobiales bacterium]
MDLHIERLIDESRTDDWHSVGVATLAHDQPDLIADPVEEVRAQVPDGSPGRPMEFHVGYADGLPVARTRLVLPTRDNTQFAFAKLEVVPAHRRRGYGRAMFEHLRERAIARDRTILVGEVPGPLEGTPPGALFAASLGAKEALRSIRRVLELTGLPPAQLERLETEARERAEGYELVCWDDHAPNDVVEDVAALLGRMVTDAPMGDLQMEKEDWDESRVREFENDSVRWGRARLAVGARAVADRRLVALTEMGVSRIQPAIAYQWDTIVAPEHRGHRLGQWVKSVNLRRLMTEMPDTKRVTTWNAEANRFMIEVNERLGFRPVDREYEWQLELADAG